MISNLDHHHGLPGQGQSREHSAGSNAIRKSDMLAQASWLLERAIAEGYRSLDELVRLDSDRFSALGCEWRRMHPARF